MKLHLRVVQCAGTTFRIVTLRPGTDFHFSTNYFHETWHILSDARGARLLGRLMWGLAFQKLPNTIVLIDGSNILPTPFGAEPSNPILLMLAGSPSDTKALQLLKRRLKNTRQQKTIRWHTFGLDRVLAELREPYPGPSQDNSSHAWLSYRNMQTEFTKEQMFRRAGFVCYVAPPPIMRWQAPFVARLGGGFYKGMNYTYLAESIRPAAGEVQIFDNYLQRCSAAATARKSCLAEGREFSDAESLYAHIAGRRDAILRQRRRDIRNRGSPSCNRFPLHFGFGRDLAERKRTKALSSSSLPTGLLQVVESLPVFRRDTPTSIPVTIPVAT